MAGGVGPDGLIDLIAAGFGYHAVMNMPLDDAAYWIRELRRRNAGEG